MQLSPAILDLCLTKTRSEKSHDYCDVIVFEMPGLNFFFSSPSSGLKSGVLEKLRFCEGLVWTVGLTVEKKLRFQISSAWTRPQLI